MGDGNAGALYFIFCLGPVASVGEEDGPALADQQGSRAARESRKIADIRKMGDQQRVQTVFFELTSKTTHAASMIHEKECSKRQLLAIGY